MKRIVIPVVLSVVIFGIACAGNEVADKRKIERTDTNRESLIAHSVDKEKESNELAKQSAPNGGDKTKWTRSGNPIDTAKFDDAIAAAEKAHQKDSGKDAKSALAEAYFKRGFALTQARQYASAIGDYRRALKYDANHADSKKWILTIQGIYRSMNREVPKEGEEPKPLEYKPGAAAG